MAKIIKNILGEYFVKNGKFTQESWDDLLKEFQSYDSDIVSFVVSKGISSEKEILSFFSKELNIEFIDLKAVDLSKDAVSKIPIRISSYYKMKPHDLNNKNMTVSESLPLYIQVHDGRRNQLTYGIYT